MTVVRKCERVDQRALSTVFSVHKVESILTMSVSY